MKRTRYLFENDTVLDFPNFTKNDIIDYDTLCVWRLKNMYNQLQLKSMTFEEKESVQLCIDEYKFEHKDVLQRLNIVT